MYNLQNLIILFFANTFIFTLNYFIITRLIYSIEYKVRSFILFLLSASILNYSIVIITSKLGIFNFKFLFTFAIPTILISLIFKLHYAKSVISFGVLTIITGLGNSAAVALFSLNGINFEIAKQDLKITVYAHVVINIVTISSFCIIKAFKLYLKMPKEVRTKAYKVSIIHILFVLIIVSGNLRYYFSGYEVNSSVFSFNVFLVLCYSIFSLFNISTFLKLELKTQELEYQLFYNKTLEAFINDLRRFKHNYSNTLAVIGGYIQTKKWNELAEYMKDIIKESNKVNSLSNTMLLNIKNAAILGLVTTKLQLALDKGINIGIIVEDEIKEVNMKIYELCEILGILLDNAIEAASDSNDKEVKVMINNTKGSIAFSIENSVNEIPDLKKIFEKDYSTKGEGRGLGLWVTNNIINRHKNVMMNTIVIKNNIKQELIVN